MKFLLSFLVLFVALVSSSCNKNKQQVTNEPNETPFSGSVSGPVDVINPPESGSVSGDTITLSGRFILFYGPSEKKISGSLIDRDAVTGFYSLAEEIINSYTSPNDIYAGYATVSNVRIFNKTSPRPVIINLGTFTEPAGLIISDGLQPAAIVKGFKTKEEYLKHINRILNYES